MCVCRVALVTHTSQSSHCQDGPVCRAKGLAFHSNSEQSYVLGIVIIATLRWRPLRHREVK